MLLMRFGFFLEHCNLLRSTWSHPRSPCNRANVPNAPYTTPPASIHQKHHNIGHTEDSIENNAHDSNEDDNRRQRDWMSTNRSVDAQPMFLKLFHLESNSVFVRTGVQQSRTRAQEKRGVHAPHCRNKSDEVSVVHHHRVPLSTTEVLLVLERLMFSLCSPFSGGVRLRLVSLEANLLQCRDRLVPRCMVSCLHSAQSITSNSMCVNPPSLFIGSLRDCLLRLPLCAADLFLGFLHLVYCLARRR